MRKTFLLFLSFLALLASCGPDLTMNSGSGIVSELTVTNAAMTILLTNLQPGQEIFVIFHNLRQSGELSFSLTQESISPYSGNSRVRAPSRQAGLTMEPACGTALLPVASFDRGSSPARQSAPATVIDYDAANPSYLIGSTTRPFWVSDFVNNQYVQITATLRAIGTNTNEFSSVAPAGSVAYVFVDNAAWNSKIDYSVAYRLAERFNGSGGIYQRLTSLIGYEWGGGANGDGGVDHDRNIYLLLTDIRDGSSLTSSSSYVAGYYSSLNDFAQTSVVWPNTWSSECQMLVIDTIPGIFHTNRSARSNEVSTDRPVSTMIHELQHMIHFNQKTHGSETWINEGCSMLAEDMLADLVPENARIAGTNGRIPWYLARPDMPLLEWPYTTNSLILNYYAKSYAFFAFLARNAGTETLAELVKGAGATNPGIEAVDAALSARGTGRSAAEAVRLWQLAAVRNAPDTAWSGYPAAAGSGSALSRINLSDYPVFDGTNDLAVGNGPIFLNFHTESTNLVLAPMSAKTLRGRVTSTEAKIILKGASPGIRMETVAR